MSRRAPRLLGAFALVALLLGALAPRAVAQEAPRGGQRAVPAELLERWRAMSPERRERLERLYRERLAARGPEERRRLRGLLAKEKRRARERAAAQADSDAAAAKAERRERYRALLRRLLRELPPEQREAFAQLRGKERRARVRALIVAHREAVLRRKLRRLPGPVRAEALRKLDALEGNRAVRAARQVIERRALVEARALLSDSTRSVAEREARVRRLLEQYYPHPRQRERIRKRLRAKQDLRDRRRQGDRQRGDDRRGRRDGAGGRKQGIRTGNRE